MPHMVRKITNGATDTASNDTGANIAPLPLNILALIISHLDSAADLARTCRTCRVLHYMTLSILYSNVTLHSYDYIRYSPIDGKPEGCGGPSPFFMGLNALVTRNTAVYVKSFKVHGSWKEYDLEECAKVGRVPDGLIMINTLIRAAIDRMPALESFSWELKTKMLPTVWLGLAQRPRLQALTVKFPSSRVPKPTMTVPPMPQLNWLKITDIDPLCYPDDISSLLESKELRHLKLHWSPRMREARETSVVLYSYFGRLLAKGNKLALKSLAFQNLYTQHDHVIHNLLEKTVEQLEMINSSVGAGDSGDMVFVDYGWKTSPPKEMPPLKVIRGDKLSRSHLELLGRLDGLEKYYLVTGRKSRTKQLNGDTTPNTLALEQSSPDCQFPMTPVTPVDTTAVSLGSDYLETICRVHGSTLCHLLLMPQWRLSGKDLSRLVQSCPNLEQLGLGLDMENFNILRLMIPFLPRLYALRALEKPDDWSMSERLDMVCAEELEVRLGQQAREWHWKQLRWIGVGEHIFEVFKDEIPPEPSEDGVIRYRRRVKRHSNEAVKDVEIWGLDCLEI